MYAIDRVQHDRKLHESLHRDPTRTLETPITCQRHARAPSQLRLRPTTLQTKPLHPPRDLLCQLTRHQQLRWQHIGRLVHISASSVIILARASRAGGCAHNLRTSPPKGFPGASTTPSAAVGDSKLARLTLPPADASQRPGSHASATVQGPSRSRSGSLRATRGPGGPHDEGPTPPNSDHAQKWPRSTPQAQLERTPESAPPSPNSQRPPQAACRRRASSAPRTRVRAFDL